MNEQLIELSKELFQQMKVVHKEVEKLEEIVKGLRIEIKVMEK